MAGRLRGGVWRCGLWAAAVLWMGLCLFLSWQPGESTARVSGALAAGLGRLLHLPQERTEAFHKRLRRSAHFVLFFIEGLLFACAFCASLGRERLNQAAVLAAAVCGVSAVLAETMKVFIPGRHLQWDETLLNVLGVLCGVTVVWLAVRLTGA